MRMLNYSRETNPFHRSLTDVQCPTEISSQSKLIPKASTFEGRHRMKNRLGKDTLITYSKASHKEHSSTSQLSTSGSRISYKTSNQKKFEFRARIEPPSTVFASLDDMDFMDSSTLSDEVCSVLSYRSKENPFKPAIHDKVKSHRSKLKIRSVRPKPLPKSQTANKSAPVSSSEFVTKGKMSGMTLMDALHRRRAISDCEKVVVEHCRRPCQAFKSSTDSVVGHTSVQSTRRRLEKESEISSQDKVPDILMTRENSKKMRRSQIQSVFQVKKTEARDTKSMSTEHSTLSPSKYANKEQYQKSSNATTTTASTTFSKSDSTQKTSMYSEDAASIVSTKDQKDHHLNDSTVKETDLIIGSTQDDRNDAEDTPTSDESKSNRDDYETTQNSEKYNRMLRMGIPMGAVENAMKRDLVDPATVRLNPDKIPSETKPPAETSKNMNISDAIASKMAINNTGANNDKYQKMLKFGIPHGAIENALQRDGVAATFDFKKVINRPNVSKKQRDPYRRTRLHWNTLKQDKFPEKSIWNAIKDDEDIDNLTIDEVEFKALFQMKQASRVLSMTKETVIENAVKVIDPKRANNGGITLARLKMSYGDIAKAINVMDVSRLNAQQLIGIMEFIPSAQERNLLQGYVEDKSIDSLCECEKFMVSMLQVLEAQKKTQTMIFMLQFPGAINEIKSEIQIKVNASTELINSLRLRKILGIILKVGNRLNRAGEDSDSSTAVVNGFSVESLSKLNQVKACDKQTTILSYIISLIQRSNQSLLKAQDDLPNVFKAHSISSDHDNALINLEKQLDSARCTLSNNNDGQEEGTNHDNDTDISHVHIFIEQASQSLKSVQDANEDAKFKFANVLEYFSTEKDLSPNTLFGIVASFCKELEIVHIELLKKKGKKKRFFRSGNIGSCHDDSPRQPWVKTKSIQSQSQHGCLPIAKE